MLQISEVYLPISTLHSIPQLAEWAMKVRLSWCQTNTQDAVAEGDYIMTTSKQKVKWCKLSTSIISGFLAYYVLE